MLFELDAEPLVGRAVKPRTESFHHPLGEHLVLGEKGEIPGIKKVG
jgi:hypothetical protein